MSEDKVAEMTLVKPMKTADRGLTLWQKELDLREEYLKVQNRRLDVKEKEDPQRAKAKELRKELREARAEVRMLRLQLKALQGVLEISPQKRATSERRAAKFLDEGKES